MIVCFECSPRTKSLLDSMVTSEQYRDYSEAISLALDNLNVLQNELSGRESLVIEPAKVLRSLNSHSENVKVSKDQRLQRMSERSRKQLPTTPLKNIPIKIPSIFLLDDLKEPLSFASPPGDVWVPGQEVPLERWIFGQYNKLLPTKVSCRALAHLLNNKPNGVPLAPSTSEIAEEALALGIFLADHDKKHGTKRDHALSTAFPSLNREVEKSRLRYASQFVAGVNKRGQISGLLTDLKLVNHTGSKKPYLKLTKAGWNFVVLRNPVLDNDTPKIIERLSIAEKHFLLDHISSSVPAEDFAYRTILAKVEVGANTPDKLDSALQEYVSKDKSKNLTKSFLASQRSGAVSRMADLGLIGRERNGVKVLYVVTDLGKQYVQGKIVPLQRREHFE